MRSDLHLAELLDFRPDQGIIRLHEQRVVILSAAAMGLLRKELVDTLGVETARRIAIRFGFADGYHDAVNLRERSTWATPLDGLRAGAMLHTLEGIVRADVRRRRARRRRPDASRRKSSGTTRTWPSSTSITTGRASAPVCWSLVGYASGFASACLGREIYFRETACAGQGEPALRGDRTRRRKLGRGHRLDPRGLPGGDPRPRGRAAARRGRHTTEGTGSPRAAARAARTRAEPAARARQSPRRREALRRRQPGDAGGPGTRRRASRRSTRRSSSTARAAPARSSSSG